MSRVNKWVRRLGVCCCFSGRGGGGIKGDPKHVKELFLVLVLPPAGATVAQLSTCLASSGYGSRA